MPSALDAPAGQKSWLLWGQIGTGKTTQFLTLPGRKFAYLFDPAALESLAGHDLTYEEFIGDEVNINPSSLSKEAISSGRVADVVKVEKPHLYDDWLIHLEKSIASGFFDDFDIIMLDSLTTLGTLAMNRQTWANQRKGSIPHLDDYGPQMGAIHAAMQRLIGFAKKSGKSLFVTGHETVKENKATAINQITLSITGQLREQLPLMFSDVYQCVADDGRFLIKTMKAARYPAIRSSLRHLTSERIEASLALTYPRIKR